MNDKPKFVIPPSEAEQKVLDEAKAVMAELDKHNAVTGPIEATKPEPTTPEEQAILDDLAKRLKAKEFALEARRKKLAKKRQTTGRDFNNECQKRGRRRKARAHRRRMARR